MDCYCLLCKTINFVSCQYHDLCEINVSCFIQKSTHLYCEKHSSGSFKYFQPQLNTGNRHTHYGEIKKDKSIELNRLKIVTSVS